MYNVNIRTAVTMKTLSTPVIEKVSLQLKETIIKLDVMDQMADTYVEYMNCTLAGVPVEIRGIVVKNEFDFFKSTFLPLKITDDLGRYEFEYFCTKMEWDLAETRDLVMKAFRTELAA